MRLRQVVVALALTVLPTATLLAALEEYNPSNCVRDTDRNTIEGRPAGGPDSWMICHMHRPSGSAVGNYSMQVNIAAASAGTRFHTCALTIEGPVVAYLAFGLEPRSGVVGEHAKCSGMYPWLANLGNRFLRCRTSDNSLPGSYKVDFAGDDGDCL